MKRWEENAGEGDSGREQAVERAADLPGKFHSVGALAEAYGALEAEFTRRSQRLRELEKAASDASAARTEAEKPAFADGGEDKTATLPADFPGAERAAGKSAGASECGSRQEAGEIGAPPTGGAETGGKEIPGGGEEDEESLYRAASRSERVRLRIVGDYLSSLKTPGAPMIRGGSGTLAAPPRKPRSIDEAGNMALLYFRKGGQA